jgi:putative Ca2+/H+ antiporter (TMEM165/GDT1 family)
MLATRFRLASVVGGVWLAFLVQTVIAIGAARALEFLPRRPIHLAAACGFLAFAYLAWRRSASEEMSTTSPSGVRGYAWLSSFLTVFAAEWGDLTQLATAALAVQSHEPLAGGLGALIALWTVTLVAVSTGRQAGRRLPVRTLDRLSAVVLLVIGVAGIASSVASR